MMLKTFKVGVIVMFCMCNFMCNFMCKEKVANVMVSVLAVGLLSAEKFVFVFYG